MPLHQCIYLLLRWTGKSEQAVENIQAIRCWELIFMPYKQEVLHLDELTESPTARSMYDCQSNGRPDTIQMVFGFSVVV